MYNDGRSCKDGDSWRIVSGKRGGGFQEFVEGLALITCLTSPYYIRVCPSNEPVVQWLSWFDVTLQSLFFFIVLASVSLLAFFVWIGSHLVVSKSVLDYYDIMKLYWIILYHIGRRYIYINLCLIFFLKFGNKICLN